MEPGRRGHGVRDLQRRLRTTARSFHQATTIFKGLKRPNPVVVENVPQKVDGESGEHIKSPTLQVEGELIKSHDGTMFYPMA